MDKKGVEITYNWIFVAIAGSILLMFLIYFAWQQVGLFNKIGVNEIVNSINNEINSFSIGVSSNKVIDLPNDVVFSFKCGDIFYKDARKDTTRLIYAEGSFSDKFNLWTDSWSFPFKIDNLYFVTDLDKRFFVVGNENFFFNIPDKIQKFNIVNQEIKKNDIIVDFSNSGFQTRFKNNKIINIDKESSLITFFPENKKDEFYSESMIYGAMFSNYEEYSCLKKRARERLSIMADLYKKKAELLKTNSKCGFLYSEMEKNLDLFKREPIKYKGMLIEQNNNIKREGCSGVF